MNAAELHLAVNHLPVLAPPFAAALLAAALLRKSRELERAGLLVLVGAGLAAIGAYWSGLGASDIVADLAGVPAEAITRHFNFARLTLWACLASAAAAIAFLAGTTRRQGHCRSVAAAGLLLAMALSGAGAWTAHLGGEIRHSEIR